VDKKIRRVLEDGVLLPSGRIELWDTHINLPSPCPLNKRTQLQADIFSASSAQTSQSENISAPLGFIYRHDFLKIMLEFGTCLHPKKQV
jgi:hypothetical protein